MIRSSRTSRDSWRRIALVAAPLAAATLVVLLLLESKRPDEPGDRPPVAAPAAADKPAEWPALPGRAEPAIAPLDPSLGPMVPAQSVGELVGRISGQVVRAADGTPLVGAIVRPLPAGIESETKVEGADAHFALRTNGGIEALEVRYQVERSWPHLPQSWPLRAVGPTDALRLEYDSGFTLSGTVADAEGHPLPGALVSVLVSGSGLWSSRYVTADADGRYRVQDLTPPPELGAISVEAQAEGYCQAKESLPLIAGGPLLRTLDFVLVRAGAIEVTARNAAGETPPQLKAFVLTDSGRYFESGGKDKWADEDGIARIRNLPPGRHTVVVRLLNSGGPLAPTRLDDVLVDAGQTTRVDVAFTKGATVRGRVTDASGAPIAKANVWFEPVDGPADGRPSDLSPVVRYGLATGLRLLKAPYAPFTNADGTFELTGVPPGRVRIVAKGDGLIRASTELVLAEGETRDRVDLELAAGVEVRGRVLLADGSPMQFCTKVLVLPGDSRSDEVLAIDETGPEGLFIADGIEPGPKRLLVVGADGSWVEAPVVPGGDLQTFVAGR